MIKEAWKVISAESRAAFAADFQKALRRGMSTNDIEQINNCLLYTSDAADD
jgi:hypothetical protein